MDGTLPKIIKQIFKAAQTWAFFDEFQILAVWSRAQKKHITEFTNFLQINHRGSHIWYHMAYQHHA